MILAWLAVLLGLGLLFWSSDKFVQGSANVASHYHVPPLLIGMVESQPCRLILP